MTGIRSSKHQGMELLITFRISVGSDFIFSSNLFASL